jgi:hypothetical protein
VLRHENADLRLGLKGKDEVIERLRAALVGMGVRGDGVDRESSCSVLARLDGLPGLRQETKAFGAGLTNK